MGIDLPLTGACAEHFDRLLHQRVDKGMRRTMKAWLEHPEEANFHPFTVEIESAAFISYGDGEQPVELWPQSTTFSRPYG